MQDFKFTKGIKNHLDGFDRRLYGVCVESCFFKIKSNKNMYNDTHPLLYMRVTQSMSTEIRLKYDKK